MQSDPDIATKKEKKSGEVNLAHSVLFLDAPWNQYFRMQATSSIVCNEAFLYRKTVSNFRHGIKNLST